MNFRSLIASQIKETHRVEAGLRDIWTADLERKMRALRKLCPAWEAHKETLLDNRELISAFMQMPEKVFHSIGPLAQDIRTTVAVVKKSNLVRASTLSEAESTAAFGTTTVAFKFVIHHCEELFPKIESPQLARPAVDRLRKQLDICR